MKIAFWICVLCVRNSNHGLQTPRASTSIQSKSIPFKQIYSKYAESYSMQAELVSHTLIGLIGIGTPVQNMSILLDTGSSVFWVTSSKCEAKACTGKSKFDGSKSSTYKSDDDGVSFVEYGDGTLINCTTASESISIGSFVVAGQNICEAYQINTSDFSVDGIMGIGPPDVDKDKSTMFNEHTQISFYYNQTKDSFGSRSGLITFGNPDYLMFTGPIVWYSISSPREHWLLSMISIKSVLNQEFNFVSEKMPVVIDTGTTMILLPSDIAEQLSYYIGANFWKGHYILSCKNTSSITPLVFSFGKEYPSVTLRGDQLVHVSESGTCYSIFQATSGVTILGTEFLKNFYTTFDYGNARIGLATPIYSEEVFTHRLNSQSSQLDISYTPCLPKLIFVFLLIKILFI